MFMSGGLFDQPTLTISAASSLTGLHQQTLRQYEQRGLVCPARTDGGTRMYSMRDVARITEISSLSAAGVSIEGIHRIFEIEDEMNQIREEMEETMRENMALREALHRERANRRSIVSDLHDEMQRAVEGAYAGTALAVRGEVLPQVAGDDAGTDMIPVNDSLAG